MRCTRCGERATKFLHYSTVRYGDRLRLPLRERFNPPGPCRNCGAVGRAARWVVLVPFLGAAANVSAVALLAAADGWFDFDLRTLVWTTNAVTAAAFLATAAVCVLPWWFGTFEAGSGKRNA